MKKTRLLYLFIALSLLSNQSLSFKIIIDRVFLPNNFKKIIKINDIYGRHDNNENIIRILDEKCIYLSKGAPPVIANQFLLNQKLFECIHRENTFNSIPEIDAAMKNNKKIKFIYKNQVITPPEKTQKKLISLLKTNGLKKTVTDPTKKNGYPNCVNIANFLAQEDDNHFQINLEDHKYIENAKDSKRFSICYLVDIVNAQRVHFLFHLAEGIFISKFGQYKTLFHTLDGCKPVYEHIAKMKSKSNSRLVLMEKYQ